MQQRQPVKDSEALLHRISRLSSEAAWTTEEFKHALQEGGVEPKLLLPRLIADVQRLLNDADASPSPAGRDSAATPPPLLVALRQHTRLPPSAIADAMDVPVPFLSMVSRHSTAVPTRWRQELARRAEHALQVDQQVVMASFAAPFHYDMAASRQTPYPTETVRNYADILDRSGMSPEARQLWQALAMDASP